MEIINVKLDRHSYPIIVGKGNFSKLIRFIEASKLNRNLFIVIDKNVDKHFGKYIRSYFNGYDGRKYFYSFHAVEKSKSFDELKTIYSSILKNKFGRDTLLISIGGGVTGDLAGFAASTFMRGIPIVHIPTTLTACVDSSIGGKTAINFDYYKNIIGSFHHPIFVLCDVNFLNTLPKIELISGLGEIIKYAFITTKQYYYFVQSNLQSILTCDEAVIEKVITDSISYKISVVSQDGQDLSLRKVLNFGHTFAHAFERELQGRIKHGEAVIAGVMCALYLSHKKKILSKELLEMYKSLPQKVKVCKSLLTVNVGRVYENMFADKKNKNNQINFVLLNRIGELVLDVNAAKSEIFYALKEALGSLNYR